MQCYDFDEMKMGRSKRRVQRTVATVEGATPRGVGVLGVGQVTISFEGDVCLRCTEDLWGRSLVPLANVVCAHICNYFFGIKHCDGKVFPRFSLQVLRSPDLEDI